MSRHDADPSADRTADQGGDQGGDCNRSCSGDPSRRHVLLSAAGVAVAASGAAFGLAACDKPGIHVPVEQVPVGGGKILSDSQYVVTQPSAGVFKAFVKLCPHAMCPVGGIEGGEIVCHCHGSRFSLTDGSVLKGPATKGLGHANATPDGKDVVISA